MIEKIDLAKTIDDCVLSLKPKSSNITEEQFDIINSELKNLLLSLSKNKKLEGVIMQLAILNPLGCDDFITSLFIGGSESDLDLVQAALRTSPINPMNP